MAQRASWAEDSRRTPSRTARHRVVSWSRTPLGPRSNWPSALRVATNLILNTPIPMCLAWGGDLTTICNSAYRAGFDGDRTAVGRPFAEVWAKDWAVIGPAVARALAGEANRVENLPVHRELPGRREASRWTFTFSPAADETGRVCGVLCVAHENRDSESPATLPTDHARLAQLFDQAPGFIAYLAGPDHVYQLINRPDPDSDLAPDRALLGKSVREAFPELEGQGVLEMLDEVYRSGRTHVESGRRIVFTEAGGQRETYVDHVYKPVRDEDGSVSGIFVMGHDVTGRMKATAALRQREERLRLAVDAGRMAVWDIDMVTGAVVASAELNRMFGLPVGASPSLDELVAQYLPGERERLRALRRAAHARGERLFEAEYRIVRADDGDVRWILMRTMADYTEEGLAARAFGVLMDITERKAAEERLKLLALEVDHRANNLLATVQSVVSLTRAQDVRQFRDSVLGRINALAQAHRLLAESRWTAASLMRIAQEELAPFLADGQVRVTGPDANLAPAAAQGLAIALHELVTNAVKHGALSMREGRIDLSWSRSDAANRAQMVWLEHGGPPASPPARAGFGLNLLRRALSGSIGGEVDLEWRAEGLCCRLTVPVV